MLKFLPLFLIVFSTNVLSENQSSILEGPTLEVIGITPVPVSYTHLTLPTT